MFPAQHTKGSRESKKEVIEVIKTPIPVTLIKSNTEPIEKRTRCKSLGLLIQRVNSNCWKNYLYKCNAGKGAVTPNKECKDCTEYVKKKQDTEDM